MLSLLVADRQEEIYILLGFFSHHLLQDSNGVFVLGVKDIADAKEVLEVEMVGLLVQGFPQHEDRIRKTIVLEMLIYFFDCSLDEGVAFDLLVDPPHDEVDLLLILAGRVVFSVYGALEAVVLLVGLVGSAGWGVVFLLLLAVQSPLAVPFGCDVIFLARFFAFGLGKDVFVFGERALVGRDNVVGGV